MCIGSNGVKWPGSITICGGKVASSHSGPRSYDSPNTIATVYGVSHGEPGSISGGGARTAGLPTALMFIKSRKLRGREIPL